MTIDEKFGEIMRNSRLDKKMTMKELGKKIGVSESTVHHYETGYRGVSLTTFFEICKILDLDVDEVQKEMNKVIQKERNEI